MPAQVGQSLPILFYQECEPLPKDIYFGSATRCSQSDDGLVYRFEDEMPERGTIGGKL